jgi:hypothetical protein
MLPLTVRNGGPVDDWEETIDFQTGRTRRGIARKYYLFDMSRPVGQRYVGSVAWNDQRPAGWAVVWAGMAKEKSWYYTTPMRGFESLAGAVRYAAHHLVWADETKLRRVENPGYSGPCPTAHSWRFGDGNP